jgi:putative transposase
MARKSRNLPVGSVVHVVNRGNDRRPLFDTSQKFEEFLGLVAWAKAICPVRIVAYCIMSNHWHFVFWVEVNWDVSSFLHRLTTTHASRWRRHTDTVGEGHVYGGRFRGSTVFNERYYYNCLRYIEQNPLRAGLVRSSRDWRWSSLRERLGHRTGILDPDPVGIPVGWVDLVDEPVAQCDAEEIHRMLKRY